MKKIIYSLIVLVFSLLLFDINVYAEEVYEKVTILTSFEEKIDLNKINGLIVTIELQSGKEIDVELKKVDNYSLDLTDIAKEPFKISMGMVVDDHLGKFDISSSVEYTTETNAVVNLIVKENIRTTSNQGVTINQELLDRINNVDEEKSTLKDEEPDVTTTTSRVITNAAGEIITTKSIEEIQKDEEKLLEKEKTIQRKARNNIYIIVFSIIGIVLIGIIIYVAIKISRANK